MLMLHPSLEESLTPYGWCDMLAAFSLGEITPPAACLSTSGCRSADATMEAAELAAMDMVEGRMGSQGSQEAAPGNCAQC